MGVVNADRAPKDARRSRTQTRPSSVLTRLGIPHSKQWLQWGVLRSDGECRLVWLSTKGFARRHSLVRNRMTMLERITLAIRKAQVQQPHRANGNSNRWRVREPNRNQTDPRSPISSLGFRFRGERPPRERKMRPLLGAAVRVCARGTGVGAQKQGFFR